MPAAATAAGPVEDGGERARVEWCGVVSMGRDGERKSACGGVQRKGLSSAGPANETGARYEKECDWGWEAPGGTGPHTGTGQPTGADQGPSVRPIPPAVPPSRQLMGSGRERGREGEKERAGPSARQPINPSANPPTIQSAHPSTRASLLCRPVMSDRSLSLLSTQTAIHHASRASAVALVL